jgi:hypothetical protein
MIIYTVFDIFRAVMAVAGFILGYVSQRFDTDSEDRFKGTPFIEELLQSDLQHPERVTGFSIGAPLPMAVLLRLQLPGWPTPDSGASSPAHSSDRALDGLVDIDVAHPAVVDLLKNSPEARLAVRRIADAGFDRIWTEGKSVWIERSIDRSPTPAELELLFALQRELAKLKDVAAAGRDPFVGRAALIHGLLWLVGAYGGLTVLELWFDSTDLHVDSIRVGAFGVMAGLALMFTVLLPIVLKLARDLSPSDRPSAATWTLVAMLFPFATVQVVSDLNRHLDSSPTIVVDRTVAESHLEFRRSGFDSPCLMTLAPEPARQGPVQLPAAIHVSSRECWRPRGQRIRLSIGRGFLRLPWYRDIHFY